jgi:preprotein translocase subunit SecB
MAENGSTETPKAAAPAQQPPQVRMQVLAQYIRDLSFENVVMQKGTGSGATPEVQVQVNIDARKRAAENQYEVILKLKVTAKAKNSEDTLFLMELDYGGIFMVDGVPEEQMHPYLLIECPRMLFPFVRRIVSDVSRDGGYPPLNLETIDFVALYRNELARRLQETKAAQDVAKA